ncbi:MAG: hypothetical protein KatS3mg088_480 [Patescibacteria group bacterium]|nr:MAG: hypothetical protein KatS3mg088_480 [Patescibacteria group bacterium]
MKKYLKRFLNNKNNLLLFLILLFAFLVRFYNFSNRVTFGPEQAISLITSGRMINKGLSLLGQENVQRITSDGHKLFSGVLFTYSLIPLQILFRFQVLPITAYFSVLNLFTGIVLYIMVRRLLSEKVALISLVLFLFNSLMIYHSLFIWILNYMPLIGILSFYFLIRFRKEKSFVYLIMLGILTGVGISLEYVYLFFAFIILFFVLKYSKKKFLSLFIFVLSTIVPNFPTLIFDLRNNFYHFFALVRYTADVLDGRAKSGITYYHFLPILPLFIVFFSYLLVRVFDRSKSFLLFFFFFYILFNLKSELVNFDSPTGMPSDLTLPNIMKSSRIIAKDCPNNFNVVVINDFDTRGHILRYPLEFIWKCFPNGVEDYPNSDIIYVLSPVGYDFTENSAWEIRSFNYKHRQEVATVGKSYSLVKFSK